VFSQLYHGVIAVSCTESVSYPVCEGLTARIPGIWGCVEQSRRVASAHRRITSECVAAPSCCARFLRDDHRHVDAMCRGLTAVTIAQAKSD